MLAQVPTGRTINDRDILAGTWKGQPVEYVAGLISLKLEDGATAADLADLLSTYDGDVVRHFGATRWGRVEVPVSLNLVDDVIPLFQSSPYVAHARPAIVIQNVWLSDSFSPLSTPVIPYATPNQSGDDIVNDPYFTGAGVGYPHQWALNNTGQNPPGGTPDADIDAPEAWVLTSGNQTVVMAVLDTGLNSNNFTREDLQDEDRVILGEDFTDGSPFADNCGHGTAVAGVMGADTNNGMGIAGVGYQNRLLIYKIADCGNVMLDLWAEAIEAGVDYQIANAGVKLVMNFSSYYLFDCGEPSDIVLDAIEYAEQHEVMFVAGTGNDGAFNLIHCPAFYAGTHENVIAVGATGPNDERAPYSNRGEQITLVAPGGGLSSEASKIFSFGFLSLYEYWTGVSFAAPHVAGTIGLMLSVWNGTLRPNAAVIRQALEDSADDIGLTANEGGAGRLNAHQAIIKMIEADPNSQIVADGATLTGMYSGTNLWILPNTSVTTSGTLTLNDSGQFESNIYVAGMLTQPPGSTIDLNDGNEIFVRPGGDCTGQDCPMLVLNGTFTASGEGSCIIVYEGSTIEIGAKATVTFTDGGFFASESGGTYVLRGGSEIISTSTARSPEIEPGTTFLLGEAARIKLENEVDILGENGNRITFSRLDPQKAWDRIYLGGANSELRKVDIDGATVGVEVSALNVTIRQTDLTNNGKGILTDFVNCAGCSNARSTLSLLSSTISNTTGIGLHLRHANVTIDETTVSGSASHGLLIEDADVVSFTNNTVTGNGTNTGHGITINSSGDLTMGPATGYGGNNVVRDNVKHETKVSTGGTLFVGSSSAGGDNSIYKTNNSPSGSGRYI